MDSGDSGSMQSSSGGEDQEIQDHEISRPEPLPGYLNFPGQGQGQGQGQFGSSDHPTVPPSFLPHYQNHNFQPMGYSFDLHPTLSQVVPQPSSSSNPNFMPDPRSTSRQPNPPPPPSSSSQPLVAPSGQTSNAAAVPPRNPKKRTRASRRAPTTVLTTDTSNFRAMVQEFTGIPAPPFSASSSSSSSPFSRRLDIFGSGLGSSPLYRPVRLSAQKFHQVQPTPFLFSSNSSPLLSMVDDATTVPISSNSGNIGFSSIPTNYQLLSGHQQAQVLFESAQNPMNLSFQPPVNPHDQDNQLNVANFGARPTRGLIGNLAMHSSLEEQLGMSRHGSSSYVNANQLGGDSGGPASEKSRVASASDHGWRGRVGSVDDDDQLSMRPNSKISATRSEGTVDIWNAFASSD